MPVQIDPLSVLVGAAGVAASILLGVVANLLTPYCQSRIRRAQDWRAKRSAAAARKRIEELSAELESMTGYLQSDERRSALVGENTMLLLGSLLRGLGMLLGVLSVWFTTHASFALFAEVIQPSALWPSLRSAAMLVPALMALIASFFLTRPASVALDTRQILKRLRNFENYQTDILSSIAALEEAAALHGDEQIPPAAERVPADLEGRLVPDEPVQSTASPDDSPAVHLDIRSARYGVGDKTIDVTDALSQHVCEGRLDVVVSNELLGSDPVRGRLKQLEVVYRCGDRLRSAIVPEYERLSLPPPE